MSNFRTQTTGISAMTKQTTAQPTKTEITVEEVTHLSTSDLNDLCDATDEAIKAGGGFSWVELPSRDILERYWQGVITMPSRILFVARLDGAIAGTAQLILPARNDEARGFAVKLAEHFVTPWARGHGLARILLEKAEEAAQKQGYSIINLDVRENQTAAINLYEGHDYVRFGTHPHYARFQGKIIKGLYYYKNLQDS